MIRSFLTHRTREGDRIPFFSLGGIGLIRKHPFLLFVMLVALTVCAFAGEPRDQVSSASQDEPATVMQKSISALQNYLGMAGTKTAAQFQPMTQKERNQDFLKSLVNPWGFGKAGLSAGLDHLAHKPEEWGQGAAGYGRRVANIEGQYLVRKTVTYGLSSALHEDNRYFGSGKKGFWQRVGYALASSALARNDGGNLRPSISQLVGVAAGAGVARLWLPDSQNSAADAAASFGFSMAGNAGASIAKEFIPDIFRRFSERNNQSSGKK
jgi:hypothetical protein